MTAAMDRPCDRPRQPRVGDTIIAAVGDVTVVQVHRRGLRLTVDDRLGRRSVITRAEAGNWVRVARAEDAP